MGVNRNDTLRYLSHTNYDMNISTNDKVKGTVHTTFSTEMLYSRKGCKNKDDFVSLLSSGTLRLRTSVFFFYVVRGLKGPFN